MISDPRIGFTATTPGRGQSWQTLSDQQLLDYCLPPRPDAKTSQQAYDNWANALSSNVVFVETGRLTIQVDRLSLRLPLGNTAAVPETARKTKETSRNWSGGYLRQFTNDRYKLMQGCWTVPGVQAGRDRPGAVPTMWKSSTWIGFDGYDPVSRSMPQIGTEQSVDYDYGKLTPKYSAWLWWWTLGEKPQLPLTLPLAIEANDSIFAQVSILDGTHVNMALHNLTKYQAVAYTVEAPQLQLPVEGRTAEWIVERQLDPDTSRFFVLPNFGTMTFTRCNAISTGPSGETAQRLERAHLIRMKDWDDPRSPGVVVSDPDVVGTDGIKITYTGVEPVAGAAAA